MMHLPLTLLTPIWVLSAMTRIEPHLQPGAEDLAQGIADAANFRPLFPEDPNGEKRTAAVLVALAFFESDFQTSVVGDHGHSFGPFQIEIAPAKDTHAFFDVGPALLSSPAESPLVALELIDTSRRICKRFEESEMLGWYASGGVGCQSQGRVKSRHRMALAAKILEDNP